MTLPRHLGFSGPPPLVEVCQPWALPPTPSPCGRDRPPSLRSRMSCPSLAPRRVLQRQGLHRGFPLGDYAVLAVRLAPTQLLHGRFAPCVLQLFEPIEALPTLPHPFARLRHLAPLLGQL